MENVNRHARSQCLDCKPVSEARTNKYYIFFHYMYIAYIYVHKIILYLHAIVKSVNIQHILTHICVGNRQSFFLYFIDSI